MNPELEYDLNRELYQLGWPARSINPNVGIPMNLAQYLLRRNVAEIELGKEKGMIATLRETFHMYINMDADPKHKLPGVSKEHGAAVHSQIEQWTRMGGGPPPKKLEFRPAGDKNDLMTKAYRTRMFASWSTYEVVTFLNENNEVPLVSEGPVICSYPGWYVNGRPMKTAFDLMTKNSVTGKITLWELKCGAFWKQNTIMGQKGHHFHQLSGICSSVLNKYHLQLHYTAKALKEQGVHFDYQRILQVEEVRTPVRGEPNLYFIHSLKPEVWTHDLPYFPLLTAEQLVAYLDLPEFSS